MKHRLAAFALLALSACGASPETAKQTPPAALARAEIDTAIGPNGAAGIASPIAFTIQAVTAAAPDFTPRQEEGQIEGDPFPLINLALEDDIVFTLLPTADHQRVHAIETRSTRAHGPHGEVVERVAFGEAIAAEVMFCRARNSHEAFDFTCSDSADGRFWRAYRLPQDYAGPTDPFESIDPDAATRAILVQMTWIAPR